MTSELMLWLVEVEGSPASWSSLSFSLSLSLSLSLGPSSCIVGEWRGLLGGFFATVAFGAK